MPTKIKLIAFVSLLLATLCVNTLEQTPVEAASLVPIRWMYYVGGRSLDSLRVNSNSIDIISPNFYSLTSEGIITGTARSDVMNLARAKGIKIVPMIQNGPVKDEFNALLSDPIKNKAILDAIEQQVVVNNFDGYHIDFEDLNSASETLLTNFMRDLYNRLHPRGKLVTMAVVSRTTSATTSQFSAAYNYTNLSPFLDLVTIMTYDFSWSTSSPGPIAPVEWQDRVISYAVPRFGANKILLGVPFYGYDWNVTQRAIDPTLRATARTYDDTIRLQQENNGTMGYDHASETPYLYYTKDGDSHQVWFENARSVSAKLDLMKRKQLRGFAAWRLGHEGTEVWPIIRNLTVPTQRVAYPGADNSNRVYFSGTGHTLQNAFKRYWETNGGLAQFGYAWTEEIEEASPTEANKNYKVQYFERNRLEYHPENVGTRYEMLLGLLGRQVTSGRENEYSFQRKENPNLPNINYYPETGHSLYGAFRTYWERNGGLFMFGYPISEEFQELNPADGKVYIVQYFERNRFEFHPENIGTKYEVMMGLLGNQLMRNKGWLQ